MKIAWIAPYELAQFGDALALSRELTGGRPCSWIVNLSTALAAREGIELHLLTESPRVTGHQTVQRGNVTFHVLESGIPGLHRGYPGYLPWDALTAFRASRRRLGRRIQEIDPALVHAHGTEDAYALAALDTGRPCVVSIQGVIREFHKTNPSLRFRIVSQWEDQVVRRCRFFTCRTHFDTAFVRSVHPGARIFEIWEAMSPVFFTQPWQPPGSEDVLFVGSLAPRKGLDHLLAAWATVLGQRPEARLNIVGGGSPARRDQLDRVCADHGLMESVRFLGRKAPAEIAALHRANALFVLPSENENSPNALSEAMISGMPVIATDVGGVTSMVDHGTTGLVVPSRAPGPLADAILELLGDGERARAMGRAGLEVTRPRHDPERVAEQTVRTYEEILAEPN